MSETTKTITWTCQHCHEPIADGKGWITIDQREVWQRRDAVQAWREEGRKADEEHQAGRVGRPIHPADLKTFPDPIRWEVTHETCDPNPDRGTDYWIGIERIRTEADLLSWSANLFGRRWFQDTAWDRIIRKAIGRVHL